MQDWTYMKMKNRFSFMINHTNKQIDDELFFKLRNHPNVIITGHQAFLTNEALQGIAETTIGNLTS